MEEEIKKLQKQIDDLQKIIQTMQENQNKQKRDYTQNTTFLERVTFRNKLNIQNIQSDTAGLSKGDIYRAGTELRIVL